MSIRTCEIMQYIEYLPGYPDKWREILEKNLGNPNIKYWVYIVHDKDVDKDGNLKPPHIHLIIILYESVYFSTAGGYFGVPKQYVQRIEQRIGKGKRSKADIGGAISYLTHRNARDKYQYDDSEVVAKPGYDWKAVRAKSEQAQAEQRSLSQVYKDIESGKIREYNLFEHISMNTYIANKSDIENAFAYRRGILRLSADRSMDVIYICGEAGSGKTTYAKQFCKKRGYSYCLSGSSRDPLQDYGGQDALILDDLRPDVFPLADLLKLLDNHSASSASARYHDRWLEAKLIIVTTILPIDKFFGYIGDKSEPITQLKRRCRTMIELSRDLIKIYHYDDENREYVCVTCAPNSIAKSHKDSSSNDRDNGILRDILADLGIDSPNNNTNEEKTNENDS